MAKKFESKIGLQPIYSTEDPNGNPATKGEPAAQIIRDNFKIIEEVLEETADETDADGNKVVRSPDGKILSSEKGQDRTKAPDLKLFTDESNNIRKNFTNVSIDQDNFMFNNKTEARSSIPVNNRSLGTTICYLIAQSTSGQYTYTPTATEQGKAISGTTGETLIGGNNQYFTIGVAGYQSITLRCMGTTYVAGGAFFNSSGVFISGFTFPVSDFPEGSGIKTITIPNGAAILKQTYATDAWLDANGIEHFGSVTLTGTTISKEGWVLERFEGDNISTWLSDSSWKDIPDLDEITNAINELVYKLYGGGGETGEEVELIPHVSGTTASGMPHSGNYYYENFQLFTGKYIKSIKVNAVVAGTFSILMGKNVNTSAYTFRKTVINLIAGENIVELNLQLEPDETIGFTQPSDTANFNYVRDIKNSVGGGFIFLRSTGEWANANSHNMNIGIDILEVVYPSEGDIGEINSRLSVLENGTTGGNLINITHPLSGKKVSILADSISTFSGVTPSGYEAPVYPTGNVNTLSKLWWGLLLAETHGVLEVANAISGSCITDSNVSSRPSFTNEQRLASLGSPDVILVFGGTNDFGSAYKRPIGSYNWGGTQDKTVFAQAITQLCSRLNTLYPNSRIVFMTPLARRDEGYIFPYKLSSTTGYLYEYSDTIKKVCDVFNIPVIDLSDCGITYENANLYLLPDLIHPNASGMRLISDYVKSALVPILNSTNLIVSNNYVTPNDIQEGSQIERINQAVAYGSSTGKRVVIPKYDTVANSDVWLIDSAILLPSNIDIELDNCRIKLSNTCRDNHFRTNNLAIGQSTIDLRENIHIKGIGNAILEGADNPRSTGDWNKVLTTNSTLASWSSYGTDAGKTGQNQYGGWLNYSVVFCNTKNFSFSGVRFVEPHAWSMAIDNSSFGIIENIIINASGGRTISGTFQYFKNQGAIIAVQGCHDLIFRNISGNNSDDIMMIGCLLVPSTSQHAATHSTGNQNTHSPSGDVYKGTIDDTYNITIQDIMADATADGQNYAIIKFTPSYLQKQYNIVVERLYSVAANKITFDYYNGSNPVIGAGKGTNKAYTLRDIKSNIRIVSNNGGEVRDSLFENVVYSGSGDPIGISKDASYNNIFENIRNITL